MASLVLDVEHVAAVREERARLVPFLEIELLELLRVRDEVRCDPPCQPVVQLQVEAREASPLTPLPVESVGIDDDRPAQQHVREIGPDGPAREHVVDVLAAARERPESAEDLVEDRLGELAVDRRQADEADALVAVAELGRGVLRHAEQRHVVPGLHESRRQLGDERVEAAPRSGDAACAEDGDPHVETGSARGF